MHQKSLLPLPRVRPRPALGLGIAVSVALLSAAAASADHTQVQLTPAGQAAARAVVLKRADLGNGAAWTGGAGKPSQSSPTTEPSCPGFHPKQSDLVEIGYAKTVWKAPGLRITSEATVMKTAAMVRLDWKRTVTPRLLPCLRSIVATESHPASMRLVSIRKIPFPQVATRAAAYRILVDVDTSVGTVPAMADFAIFYRGRTEVYLTFTAPAAWEPTVGQAEIRLARLLASRVQSPAAAA
jgi:hypothetical protein